MKIKRDKLTVLMESISNLCKRVFVFFFVGVVINRKHQLQVMFQINVFRNEQ